MAFCSYFKIQPVAGGADRIKKSEWKLVSHDNSQPLRRAGTAAAFYRFRRLPASYHRRSQLPRAFVGASISPPLPRPSVSPSFLLSLSFSPFDRSFLSVSFFSCAPHSIIPIQLFPPLSTRRLALLCNALLFQSVSRLAPGIAVQPSRVRAHREAFRRPL